MSELQELLQTEAKFRYMLLSRMQGDCEYFLGNGQRYVNHLWAETVEEQIEYMKALWNSFPSDEKPEWLSYEQILDYEKRMTEQQNSKKRA